MMDKKNSKKLQLLLTKIHSAILNKTMIIHPRVVKDGTSVSLTVTIDKESTYLSFEGLYDERETYPLYNKLLILLNSQLEKSMHLF